jgi:hypothetical protein
LSYEHIYLCDQEDKKLLVPNNKKNLKNKTKKSSNFHSETKSVKEREPSPELRQSYKNQPSFPPTTSQEKHSKKSTKKKEEKRKNVSLSATTPKPKRINKK